MFNKLLNAACITMISILLTSCDQKHQAAQAEEEKYELQNVGLTTYLIEQKGGAVYALQSGEFVRIPRIEMDTKDGGDIKTYDETIRDLEVHIRLKYFGGRLNYQIEISPKYTPEYAAYLIDALARATQKIPRAKDDETGSTPELKPLAKPEKKYKNPNWESYWSVPGNALLINLLDKDTFKVTTISLYLNGTFATPRTHMVDSDESTTGMDYEGSLDITATNFQRIESSNTTYVLEKAITK